MAHPTKPSSFAVGLLTVALACSGCRDRTERPKQDSTTQASGADSGYILRGEHSAPFFKPLMLLDGKPDLENRYPSVVLVKPDSSVPSQECSGVLIDPRWVLTSAYCVCAPRKAVQPGQTSGAPVDGFDCAATATVTAVAYLPPLPDGGVRSLREIYKGVVRPHPQFKYLLRASDAPDSSRADLALIRLEGPVSPDFPPVKLTDNVPQASESLILVGYGDDESRTAMSDARRFSRHQVLGAPKPDSDRIVLRAPTRLTHQDDLGGPCLRDTNGSDTLIGVSQRGLGTDSTCTSTHTYKAWLNGELRHAAQE